MNTENNKLIAEFMGIKPVEVFGRYSISKDHCTANCETKEEAILGFCKMAKYNSDWNWLMEVVEKIETHPNSNKFGTVGFFGLGRTIIHCYDNEQNEGQRIHTIDILGERYGITPTYIAVVAFIKWYNQTKN